MYYETNIIYISKDKYAQKLFWYYYPIEPYKFYFDFDWFNTIFYEIKRTNYLYGNVISWKYIRIAMKISFSHILKTHYSTQCIHPMTSTVVNGADKMDPI